MAVTLADWEVAGPAYARAMIDNAQALAGSLTDLGVPVFASDRGATTSHQFAVLAHTYGGGQAAARTLRRANLLACGIGLPVEPVDGDVNGLRIGTPELTRLGMTAQDMPQLASFIARGLGEQQGLGTVGEEVTEWRSHFSGVHFTTDKPN